MGTRIFHHLPYYYAKIDLSVEIDRPYSRVVADIPRRGRSGSKQRTAQQVFERTQVPARAHFPTERYRYYTEAPDGPIRSADLQHDPWPLDDTVVEIDENTLFAANGFPTPDTEPVHFYSPGVETIASKSRRIPTSNLV